MSKLISNWSKLERYWIELILTDTNRKSSSIELYVKTDEDVSNDVYNLKLWTKDIYHPMEFNISICKSDGENIIQLDILYGIDGNNKQVRNRIDMLERNVVFYTPEGFLNWIMDFIGKIEFKGKYISYVANARTF
jgi:hypothetical protein